jgi:colanic acid/amylovoran biosynthesis glycosyltransferase
MDIILFTNFFPYKRAEPFLVNEFEFTKKFSDSVSVFTLYGNKKDKIVTDDVFLFDPLLPSSGSKSALLIKGKFNFAPFAFHVAELWKKRIFLSPKKLYWWSVSVLITRLALSSQSYKQLLERIKSLKKPVLYFYWSDNLTAIIPYLVKDLKTKNVQIVIRFHGSDLYEELKGGYAPLRMKSISHANKLFCVSEFGASYLKNKYPSCVEKIIVSRLGVRDNGTNPMPSGASFRVISVSNLVSLKRVDRIFEALQNMTGEITWDHFGEGPLMDDLKELFKSKRKGLMLNLHGNVSNKTLIDFYKTTPINVFVNFSTTEGLPVSIMEALSFGIPVIAPNVGGVGELINDSVGVLLNAGSTATDLENALGKIKFLPEEQIGTMRQNARKVFLDKVFADLNYTAFYDQVRY